jgi:hypothetical protein
LACFNTRKVAFSISSRWEPDHQQIHWAKRTVSLSGGGGGSSPNCLGVV